MRIILGTLFILSFGSLYASSDVRIDTIYYDRDWKSVSHKAFATYYRVYEIDDSKESKAFRDFYITGELQAEGHYLSIDKNDDYNSVFDGKCIKYFKSGEIEQIRFLQKGVEEGEYTIYYENGLVKVHSLMKNGKMNGIMTQFSEDGNTCTQIEMENGEPKYDYYVVSNKDGLLSKYRISDNSQIWETPDVSEKKVYYIDGKACSYYLKNGILLSMTNSQVKDYGKWFQVSLLISNQTMTPFDIQTSKIKAYIINEETKEKKPLTVYSSGSYASKVKKSQDWQMFLSRIAERFAAASAGFSSSVIESQSSYNGKTNVHGSASAQGSLGRASASFDGFGTYSGSSNMTSKIVSYNGAAAYQAQVIASNRLADSERAFQEELAIKEGGYLKRTTIYPGETVAGYVNIVLEKGNIMDVVVDINGTKYTYRWIPKGGFGTLRAANALLPKDVFPNMSRIPPLPCEAEIIDKDNNKMKVIIISIDSELIVYRAYSENGKHLGPLLSYKTDTVKSLIFNE